MTTLLTLIAILIATFILCWVFDCRSEVKQLQKQEYISKYNRIQCYIDHSEITLANYQWLTKLIIGLGKLPYKNKEMASVMLNNFSRRFEKYSKPEDSEVNYPIEGIEYRQN